MARLIPAVVGDETRSPGERSLFRRFETEGGTDDWIVLHSLDVVRHRTRLAGEVDFVIIVPGLGVLCLEVKAHQRVSRDAAGLWHLGGDKPSRIGPFRQASDAMHSVRDRVTVRPELRGVLFWSAVCFTAVPFQLASSLEWHEWQVIDSSALAARPLADLVRSVLVRAREHVERTPSGAWLQDAGPTLIQADSLVKLLRPEFEFSASPKARRRDHDQELIRFTEDQFVAIDAMTANSRVVFEGPAGTGKTLLALEECRRAVLRGERVALVCFNRLLGNWLKAEFEPNANVVVGSLHSVMVRLSSVDVPPLPTSQFWSHQLPDLVLETLLDGPAPLFDTLIVDEAQDVLRSEYLDVLDAMLVGGLQRGRWRLFGDFTRQALYGTSFAGLEDFMEQRGSGAPVFSLHNNCRNTPRIAAYSARLSGFQQTYRNVLRPDSGLNPKTHYWESEVSQIELLSQVLTELRADGYSGREIVILSKRAFKSAAESLPEKWRSQLRPAGDVPIGGIRHCSIHAFKGLESPVVIVTDIDALDAGVDDSLFYVAGTRATERLYVLASAQVKAAVIERSTRRVEF
jgi:hypothetical protein